MGLTLFLFLGAVSGALASALFLVFGYLSGDGRLVRMTAAAAFACGVLAIVLGTML